MNRNGMRHVLIRTGHCVCAMCNAERMSSSSSSDDDEESKRDKELISVGEGRMIWCGNQEGGHAYIYNEVKNITVGNMAISNINVAI